MYNKFEYNEFEYNEFEYYEMSLLLGHLRDMERVVQPVLFI